MYTYASHISIRMNLLKALETRFKLPSTEKFKSVFHASMFENALLLHVHLGSCFVRLDARKYCRL